MMNVENESKVGKHLSEKLTKRVIILVLAMLFSVPLFTVTTYFVPPNSLDYGLDLISTLGPTTKAGKLAFEDTILVQQDIETPLIGLYINTNLTYSELTHDHSNTLEWKD